MQNSNSYSLPHPCSWRRWLSLQCLSQLLSSLKKSPHLQGNRLQDKLVDKREFSWHISCKTVFYSYSLPHRRSWRRQFSLPCLSLPTRKRTPPRPSHQKATLPSTFPYHREMWRYHAHDLSHTTGHGRGWRGRQGLSSGYTWNYCLQSWLTRWRS